MSTPFNLGDTIEFTRAVKIDGMFEFQMVCGEVVELPENQRHLTHLVCIKKDNGETRSYKRADMMAPIVVILGSYSLAC